MEKEIKKKIEELVNIRRRITQLFIQLGNPHYVQADSVLNEDINKLQEKFQD